jgi:hypothetical protein
MTTNKDGKCKQIRAWFHKIISDRFGPDAKWIRNHIAHCPRCQRRLAAVGKVNLALSVLKSQPHNLDLLKRANSQAIGVLKHSLREAPKAGKLKRARPEPKLPERSRKYVHPGTNVAACIAVLLLMKMGIFSSVDKFQSGGQEVMKQYYASRAGQDVADDMFTA